MFKKKGIVLLALVLFFGAICFGSVAIAKKVPAPIEKTGQTTCYDSDGNVIACAGTGQDGEYQKGLAWPNPRFTENSDGTVTDNLTGLIWLKNANCAGTTKKWADALTYCNNLASGSCGLTDGSVAGNWRLPNVKELQSLIDLSSYNPALPSGHPFTGVQINYYYWSSTTVADDTIYAWIVDIKNGYLGSHYKGRDFLHVWPVRGGND
jgi:hypothetical protein